MHLVIRLKSAALGSGLLHNCAAAGEAQACSSPTPQTLNRGGGAGGGVRGRAAEAHGQPAGRRAAPPCRPPPGRPPALGDPRALLHGDPSAPEPLPTLTMGTPRNGKGVRRY